MFVATVYDVTLETMHQLERLIRKTKSSKFMFVATVVDDDSLFISNSNKAKKPNMV